MAVEVNNAPDFEFGQPRLLFKAQGTAGGQASWDGQQFLFLVHPKPRGGRFPRQIIVFDRQGKVVRTLGEPGAYTEPMRSPDGTQVGSTSPLRNNDIHVFDVSTGKRPGHFFRVFGVVPDRSGVVSGWQTARICVPPRGNDQCVSKVFRRVGQGGTAPSARVGVGVLAPLTDWSPDGLFLAYSEGGVLWTIPANGQWVPVEFVREEFTALGARFSPNSRYIAYVADESGRNEVYVRRFDASTGAAGVEKWQVSKDELVPSSARCWKVG